MLANQAQACSQVALSNIAARTSTVTGSWIDARAYEGDLLIQQLVGTIGGTPTLDGKLQDATDGSGTGAADVAGATFTQVTAADNVQKITVPAGSIRGWIRYVGTIAGGSPSLTMGVMLLAHPKYTT